ncbi:hypothetical protein [Solilutibacter silvestris]|nr:hypothetical protein [Lysobacter silvestris]
MAESDIWKTDILREIHAHDERPRIPEVTTGSLRRTKKSPLARAFS